MESWNFFSLRNVLLLIYELDLFIFERDQLINFFVFFFFNDTATTEIYTLSLHDALPILKHPRLTQAWREQGPAHFEECGLGLRENEDFNEKANPDSGYEQQDPTRIPRNGPGKIGRAHV